MSLVACLLIASAMASAQQAPRAYVHEAWTVQDGLPVNSINGLVQSRAGYIWAATFDGLVRFDGVRFTVFNMANSEGLPSNRIVKIREARNGALWLLTEQAQLVRFRDGKFTHFGPQHGLVDDVNNIYEDRDGVIWVGTNKGLGSIRDERFAPVARQSLQLPILAILRRRDGTLWAGGRGGLYTLTSKDTTTTIRAGLDTELIRALYEDAAGTLWAGGERGIWKESTGWQRIQPKSTPLDEVFKFATESATGTLFAYARSGVFRITGNDAVPIDPRARMLINPLLWTDSTGAVWYATRSEVYRNGQPVYALSADTANSFPSETITDLLFDHEGSIWLGTQRAGLHRLKPALFTVYSEAEGMTDRNVTTVYQDRAGHVWVGTRRIGMSRIDGNGHVTSYTHGILVDVHSLLRPRAGNLLIGSKKGVVSCALPAMTCANAGFSSEVFAMAEDADGRIWLGTAAGLFRSNGKSWTRIPESAGSPGQPVRVFAQTDDGALWLGTNGGGLARYHAGAFTHVTSRDGLPTDLIRSLYQDADGWLWVGTEGRGLARLDPRAWSANANGSDKRIVRYRMQDGLFDDVIHQTLEDDFGRLWMSTNRGIFWVARAELNAFADGRTKTIRSTAYTERDGLRNREANGGMQPAGIKTRDGRLWFATQDGVAVVDPAHLESNRVPPPVVIERVIAKDVELPTSAGSLQLDVDQRDLQIDYTALSFLAPANVRFRYQLAPYDADWVDAGNRRTAFYTRVPPGRYTFRVLASNNEGVWNEQGAALELLVTPRIWETRGFRLTLVLALALAAFVALRLREHGLRRRAIELEEIVADRTAQLREMDQAKSRLFANLSHEFRTPLTLILGPLRSLLDGRHGALPRSAQEQHELMLRNGQRLLRLINQVLDLAKLQAKEVRLQRSPYDLVGFARTVTLAFAPLAERRTIALRFHTDLQELTLQFDAEQLEKVLLNLLSNALKFTEDGGQVEASVRRVNGRAEIAVRDTGVGIAPAQLAHVFERFYQADTSATRRYEGTGIGLALAKELVELHGGEIRAQSTPGVGSTFIVTLPLGDAAATPHATQPPAPVPVPMSLDEHVALDTTSQAEAEEEEEDRTTVLVIDDNADVRSYVRSVLATSYRIIEASDGRAGLERARAELPDLIVADVMMPELDGLALGRELKTDRMTDAIPVVLLTARAATEDQVAGLETGADAYLVKPFDPAVLEAQVANLLAQRIRLRERFRHGDPVPSAPAPPSPSELELRLRPLVEARLHDPDFSPAALAQTAGLSYQQMYRALRDELRTTPSRFIRTVRVECAAELLHQRAGSITEIGYSVGFESISYFNRAFRERFGCAPSEHTAASTA